ncbi:MAG: precorrin-8X methylmutase [Eubacteriales bacterium]
MTYYLPNEIEEKSFQIITEELENMEVLIEQKTAPILKRVIHTSADFEYVENLVFSETAVDTALEALSEGCVIVTDTNMALAGINKPCLAKLGCEAYCYIGDEDVRIKAKENGTTRATQSMIKASEVEKPLILVIGNAPTALIQLHEMIEQGAITPRLIIGVPVGFVNVVESKELIMQSPVPYIVAKGRKGGSNVAAAIVNALMYMKNPSRS